MPACVCGPLTSSRVDTTVAREDSGWLPKEPAVVGHTDRYLLCFGVRACGACSAVERVEHRITADDAPVDFIQPHRVAEFCGEMHCASPDDACVWFEEAHQLFGRGHRLAAHHAGAGSAR